MCVRFLAILIGLALIIFGILFFKIKISPRGYFYKFLRNDCVGTKIFFIPCCWFILKLSQLGEADFGEHKLLLICIFTFTFVGIMRYWNDFISVRGISMLCIILIYYFLKIGYMHSEFVRPYLSLLFYILIVIATILCIYPYLMRNAIDYMFNKNKAYKNFGSILAIYGSLLMIFSFF